MAGEWREHEVSQLLVDGRLVIGDGYRAKNDELSTRGLPFARAGNINDGFRFDDADHFPEVNLSRVGNKISEPGDVVFTSKGTVGRFGFVREHTPRFVYSPQLCFWRSVDCKAIDARFLYYWMCGREFFVQFKGVAGQTDMAEYVSLTDQRRMHITLPPPDEQRAIAHILGTLDDKIELNRRMNETLEAMARALFKSWFVDFAPVRAKAEGRDPGLPQPLADLFPARLVDSELGEIPEGWEVRSLDDLSGAMLGGDWGADEPSPNHTQRTRCIRGADIPDLQAGGMGKMPIRYLKPSSLQKRGLSDGDLVVEISGGSPTQSTGRPVLVSDRLLQRLDAPLVCSNFCRLLKPLKRVYSTFLYLWLRSLYSADEFLQFENGTTGIKNLAFTLFSSQYKLCAPPDEVLAEFEAQVVPVFVRQQSAAAESDRLAALRNTLLPKLISGELRVKDGAHIALEATV